MAKMNYSFIGISNQTHELITMTLVLLSASSLVDILNKQELDKEVEY